MSIGSEKTTTTLKKKHLQNFRSITS